MEKQLKANAENGIPSVAIILYNGKDRWNPLEKLQVCPKELRRYLLPFKCILLNVKDVPNVSLDGFGARLAAFICAMKFVRDPENAHEIFKKILDRVRTELPQEEALDLLHQMDVYLQGWLKKTFLEAFKMDFIRPDYETVGDAFYEEGEKAGLIAGEKSRAEETARKMLVKNKPIDEIVEFSGLTVEQIRALQA